MFNDVNKKEKRKKEIEGLNEMFLKNLRFKWIILKSLRCLLKTHHTKMSMEIVQHQ